CDAIERKDREDIERIVEEADAKDRTGWFKRTQWDEHLQAYPDWQLLSYAILRYLEIRYAGCVVQSFKSLTSARSARTYVLRLSHALICQELYGQPFASAIVHFLAALGIYPETSCLRTAAEFSSMLGSLVYCVRVLAIEFFLLANKRAEQGAAETNGSYSPMSTMLSLLVYAKFIALRTPGTIAGSMWWSTDRQTFYIKGRPIVLQ
ncbi:hypothetical protein GGP41_005488, partial [Bipolaris sorokiniana]